MRQYLRSQVVAMLAVASLADAALASSVTVFAASAHIVNSSVCTKTTSLSGGFATDLSAVTCTAAGSPTAPSMTFDAFIPFNGPSLIGGGGDYQYAATIALVAVEYYKGTSGAETCAWDVAVEALSPLVVGASSWQASLLTFAGAPLSAWTTVTSAAPAGAGYYVSASGTSFQKVQRFNGATAMTNCVDTNADPVSNDECTGRAAYIVVSLASGTTNPAACQLTQVTVFFP